MESLISWWSKEQSPISDMPLYESLTLWLWEKQSCHRQPIPPLKVGSMSWKPLIHIGEHSPSLLEGVELFPKHLCFISKCSSISLKDGSSLKSGLLLSVALKGGVTQIYQLYAIYSTIKSSLNWFSRQPWVARFCHQQKWQKFISA